MVKKKLTKAQKEQEKKLRKAGEWFDKKYRIK